MIDYFQYVHNLKGGSRYDNLKPRAREAIVSLLLRQIESPNTLEKAIKKETSHDVLDFISKYLNLKTRYSTTILSTDTTSYVEGVNFDNILAIINLHRINNTQRPNKLLRSVNTLLPLGGVYIGTVESYGDRKNSFFEKYGKARGEVVWLLDYVINRILPRLNFVDKIYYWFTDGRLHCISHPEILGRLVYCGFSIVDTRSIEGVTYFVARKSGSPVKSATSSYYPIVKLPRIGKDGRLMHVYKIRTMHPYSEYIQEYMINKYGYDDTGKPANDYRITRLGKIFRNLWIDELPQLIQVLKGEMKMVGVRPLSQVRINDFPEDLKAERFKLKPGCIAPYVSLNMPGFHESIEAERIYINDYKQHPFRTDVRYFLMGVRNILLNRVKH